ncbi:MAG: type II secretion system F family protein [Phycisphaerales bacterium]|nr:MAG: type II secretion system F family protein [Phycisphaerales bacterium]
MASYAYTARDAGGLRREGYLQADSSVDAIEALRQRGLTPTSVQETDIRKRAKHEPLVKGRTTSAELAALCWQLSAMLDGGVAVTAALAVVAEDTENRRLRSILDRTFVKVSEGQPLSDGFKAFPQVFSNLTIATIVAGETSGNLGHALHKLAEYFDHRDKLAKQIKTALAYPVFVLVLISVIVLAIMVFVVPRFRQIFDQLGNKLPAFTQAFMNVHETLSSNALHLMGAAVVVICGIVLSARTKQGHAIFSRLILRLPIFGRLVSELFIATFCTTTATLLEAGVPVLDVFDILANMTRNDVIAKAITKTKKHLADGSNIAMSMASAGFFPNMVVKMTQVGEESGSLTEILRKTSEHYVRRVGATIDAVISLLEPLMIVFIGAIVLVAVIALYLPIFSISDVAG